MKPTMLKSPFARALTVILASVCVAMPFSTVINGEYLIIEALLTAIAIVVIGMLTRLITQRFRGTGRIPVTLFAQAVMLAVLLTVRGFQHTAFLGVFPSWETLPHAARAIREAIRQIVQGVAPLEETLELHVLGVLGIGIFAIALYALLVWSRSPLPAALFTIAVSAAPSLVVRDAFDLTWFTLTAIVVLLMFWQCAPGRESERPAALGAAVAVAALATAGAMFATTLTAPGIVSPRGGSGGYELSANLELGEDLRRATPITALTYVTPDEAPYLRIATLTQFDSARWQPDAESPAPLTNPIPQDPILQGIGAGTFDEERAVSITIQGARGDRLPVPYIASTVEGLTGNWNVLFGNHTVVGRSIEGQTYDVTYRQMQPSIEELRSAVTSFAPEATGATTLPSTTPLLVQEIALLASQAGATDIDRLLALQAWFRTEFEYSLEPPVADEPNMQVIEAFLNVRSGYCVHFASAFTVIARAMGMPTRVVVGFLPGEQIGSTPEGNRYRVSTNALHAWPEVFFEQYGWVPFEPTATLGAPTEFESTTTETPGDETEETPEENTEDDTTEDEAETPGQTPDDPSTEADESDTGDPEGAGALNWVVVTLLVLLTLALLPVVLRITIRLRRTRASAQGDVIAGWRELTATMTDLGIMPEEALTPRAARDLLTHTYHVRPDLIDPLISSLEQAVFAEPQAHPDRHGAALRPLLRNLRSLMGWPRWLRSLIVPASLMRRPDRGRDEPSVG